MKYFKFKVLILFCLLPLFSSGKNVVNDLTMMNLKGKVKAVKETVYAVKENSGDVQRGDIMKILNYLYNKNGNQLELREFDANEKLVRNSVSVFDDKGQLKEKKWFGQNESLIRKSTFRYDEKGNEIEMESFNPDGSSSSKSTSAYDRNNWLIELDTYSPDGTLYNRQSIKNNNQGKEIERILSYPDGSVEWRSASRYDTSGNLVEKNDIPSCCMRVKYKYKYDDKGNQIEEISSKADGSMGTRYTYEFGNTDIKGNWLKKITVENSMPSTVTFREIEYY